MLDDVTKLMKCIRILAKKALSIQIRTTLLVGVVTKHVVMVPGTRIDLQFWVSSVEKLVRFN